MHRISFKIINRSTNKLATAEEIHTLLDAAPPKLFISWPSDGVIEKNNLIYNASVNISASAAENYFIQPIKQPINKALKKQQKFNFRVEVITWFILIAIITALYLLINNI